MARVIYYCLTDSIPSQEGARDIAYLAITHYGKDRIYANSRLREWGKRWGEYLFLGFGLLDGEGGRYILET